MKCTFCDKPLTGGLDTFGLYGEEACWECYAKRAAGELHDETEEVWYGLAPHHHDLSITGGVMGSTVIDPLPTGGEIDLGDTTLMPDPEAPGLGTYQRKIMPGWR